MIIRVRQKKKKNIQMKSKKKEHDQGSLGKKNKRKTGRLVLYKSLLLHFTSNQAQGTLSQS